MIRIGNAEKKSWVLRKLTKKTMTFLKARPCACVLVQVLCLVKLVDQKFGDDVQILDKVRILFVTISKFHKFKETDIITKFFGSFKK